MQSTLPQPGASVWIRGQRWRVSRVRGDRTVARVDVTGDRGPQVFLVPFDRPLESAGDSRPIRARRQRVRARLASLCGTAFSARTLGAAVHARAEILPHQLEPVLAILSGVRRILIGDEVGLGKTIQAGLIAAELVRREPSARVLIVVPAALVSQWRGEMRERFRIDCVPVDRASMDLRARERAFGENPWDGSGVFLASLDYLKQEHVLTGIPVRPWDLLIVDEAHGACGHSDRYASVDHLGRRSRRVVLMTATPHSGDEERFSRLLRAGALPGDQLVVFRRRRVSLGLTGKRRIAWHRFSLSDPEQRVFAALRAFERIVLRSARHEHLDEARLLIAVLEKRALSTMAALNLSIDRRLVWLSSGAPADPQEAWVQPGLNLGDEDQQEDITGADDLLGLRARTGLAWRTEQSWLERLSHLASLASGYETKIRRVVRLLSRASEPAIVFTEFRDSLHVLTHRMRLIRPFSTLHGGMNAAERSAAIQQFESGNARVLLATDVAGQGLNLQHQCRWVISLELPWNPARLEQRIGRVDRIGQRRPVHVTLPVARDGIEAGMVARLKQRACIAGRTLGEGSLLDMPGDGEVRAADHRVPMATARWSRLASRAARSLEARRRLAEQWRGPERFGRPLRAPRPPRFTSPLGPSQVGARLFFSIPLLDRAGTVVEMRLVAVSAPDATRENVCAAGRAAVTALQPRLRRLRRAAAALLPARIEVEHALSAVLTRDRAEELQPGLFDAAALRAFEIDRRTADDVAHQLEMTIERLRVGCAIEAGQPTLEVAWINRP